jgi:hypothetical protein
MHSLPPGMVRLVGTGLAGMDWRREGRVGPANQNLSGTGRTGPPKPLYCTPVSTRRMWGVSPNPGSTRSFKDEAMPRRPLLAQPQFAPKTEPPLNVRGEFVPPKRRPRKQKPRVLAPLQAVNLRMARPSKHTVSPIERAREREQERNDQMWQDARAQQRQALRAARRAYRRTDSVTPPSGVTASPASPNH